MSTQTMISNIYPTDFARAVGVKPAGLPASRRPAGLAAATLAPLAGQPLMFSLRVEMPPSTAAGHLNRLMLDSKYPEAATYGQKVHAALADQPGRRLELAENDVAHALALNYIGAQSEGKARLQAIIAEREAERKPEDVAKQGDPKSLEGKRRNHVLGRAHNNLGYILEQQEEYALALWQLGAALPYFQASELWEELANTYDNMGRVLAKLVDRDLAESFIQAGLKLRRELKRDERTCLSLISYANFHLSFGEPIPAEQLALDALSMAKRSGKQRQIGLACIVRGRSSRQLAALACPYSHRKRTELLRQAQEHLVLAEGIFEKSVDELVRRVEVYVELGCTYRDLAALLNRDRLHSRPGGSATHLVRCAQGYLQEAIRLAQGKYPTLYRDAWQAQAKLQSQSQELVDNRPGYGAPSNRSGTISASSMEFLDQALTTAQGCNS